MTNILINRQQRNIDVSQPRSEYHLPIASETTLGGIKVGSNLSVTSDGTLSAVGGGYSLPVASPTTLGGIKVGDKLSIQDGVLSADVDSTLSSQSSNPVSNATLTSALNALSNASDTLDDRLDTVENNLSTLTSTVTSQGTAITGLDTDISALETAVENNTTNIGTNTGNITANATAIADLDDRLDTAESNITDQGNAIDEMAGEINDFTLQSDTTVDYSYLLPVNTWSSGTITYSRRGKIGLIQFDMSGIYELQSGVDSQIYQLPATFQNSVTCSGVLITDDGCIEVKLDLSRNIIFYNHTNQTQHITSVKGQLTVVLD